MRQYGCPVCFCGYDTYKEARECHEKENPFGEVNLICVKMIAVICEHCGADMGHVQCGEPLPCHLDHGVEVRDICTDCRGAD